MWTLRTWQLTLNEAWLHEHLDTDREVADAAHAIKQSVRAKLELPQRQLQAASVVELHAFESTLQKCTLPVYRTLFGHDFIIGINIQIHSRADQCGAKCNCRLAWASQFQRCSLHAGYRLSVIPLKVWS